MVIFCAVREKTNDWKYTNDDICTGVACETDLVETASIGCQTDDDFMKEYSRLKSENEILKKGKECLTMKLAKVEETVLSCNV